MTEPLTWFRLHADTIDDPKLKILAVEDRWYFIGILCCKAQGIQDKYKPNLVRRMIAAKLGLDEAEFDQVIERLAEMNLIDRKTYGPIAWDKRQYRSDKSAERVRRYRKRLKEQQDIDMKRYCNVTVTPPETETETETETEKEQKKKNIEKKKSQKKDDAPSARFVRPTVEEVREYCKTRKNSVDPEQFVDFYEAKGWMIGKGKMKSWKACVRTWERNDKKKQPLADPADRWLT